MRWPRLLPRRILFRPAPSPTFPSLAAEWKGTGSILGITLVNRGVAVHLFFVVSGFYMALILSKKYRDRRTFYLNRLLRLWPTFLAVLVAAHAWLYADWLYTGKMPPPLWVPEAFAAMPFWQAFLLHAANFTMVGADIPYFFAYLRAARCACARLHEGLGVA